MHGAIAGDFIGSRYEHNNIKTKGFALFGDACHYTDDTVMTAAVADALMKACDTGAITDEKKTKDLLIDSMHRWGDRYPYAGYGRKFYYWLRYKSREPYRSWGNGSAMRVSPVGWIFDDIDTTRRVARWTAEVTHSHPEGVKGAEAAASAIFLARTGFSKEEIRSYISKAFSYNLNRTCDEIRPGYTFNVSCQGSVPEAVISFLDGCSCVDTIRNAVSLGGDSDTIAAMAGSIAEAYYGTDTEWMLFKEAERKLPEDIREIMVKFDDFRRARLEEMEIIHKTDISEGRIRLLPERESRIVKDWLEGRTTKQIAEEYEKTEQEILRVIHKALRYCSVDRLVGRNIDPDFVWYINSIIDKSQDSTLWLKQLAEPRRFLIPCAFKFGEPEELVLGIMIYAEKIPATAAEYSQLTGYNERRMRMAVNRVMIQIRNGRSRRRILESLEREDGEIHD